MTELQKIQQGSEGYRKELAEKDFALQKANAVLSNLRTQEVQVLKTLDEANRQSKSTWFGEQKKKLSDQIEKIKSEKKSLLEQLEKFSGDFLNILDLVEKVKELDDAFPLLMFPLRLETRFKSTGNQPQLWLRAYPDDCNINTKEELLSESELSNAKLFWIEMWKAGGIEAEERAAWRSLVNSHGSGRSEWITRQYKPTNNQPTKVDGSHKILVVISTLTLTTSEHLAARNYWAAAWLAMGNPELISEAFGALKLATAKATEIVAKYIPENIGDLVPEGIQNGQIALEKLDLPSPEEYTTTKTSWTKAPTVMAFPDKLVAVLYNGPVKRTVLFPYPVKENLAVGPDPSLTAEEQIQKDPNGDIIVNQQLAWMVDFEKSIQAGMGVKINLTPDEATTGFTKLIVIGIRFTSDENASKTLLEKLLTDHFYSKNGFGLLKQGTPTNNTEDEPAGYSWIDNPDESYDRIFKGSEDFELTEEPAHKTDGQKLADLLGINPAALKHVPNAAGKDQLEANAMNTALFPATLGYFMEEMMDPLFSDKEINDTKKFFSDYVSGRGPIPALRIGKQPYAILPISVYSKLKFSDTIFRNPGAVLNGSYLTKLHHLIMKMDTTWDSMVSKVAYIGKAGDPHQILLDVVGLHANSVEFHQRYAQSFQQMYNQLVLQMGGEVGGLVAISMANRGASILEGLGMDLKDIKLPILDKYFLSEPNLLTGPLVDDVASSEIDPVRAYSTDGKNYVEWLASSHAEMIRTENFGGNPAPKALLYLLLRHALMQAQAKAAIQLLVANGLVKNKRVFYDPDFIHVEKNGAGKSKFENLYSPSPPITGSNNINLIDYIYRPEVLGRSPETKQLSETLEALKVLKKTPTARLERLLVEHFDCCNYRIDAWKTGLVNYNLTERRNVDNKKDMTPKGLYLGAYGWLLDVKPENKILTDVKISAELNEIFNKGNKDPLQTDSKNLGYIHAPSLNQAGAAAILRNAYDSHKTSGTGNPFAINLTSDRVRIANSFLEGIRNGQTLSALLGYQFERGLHDKYNLGQGEVDQFIYPLRKAFPLVADNLVETKSEITDSIETIEANNVIDGLKLINHIQSSTVKSYPFGLSASYGLPTATASQAQAINEEVSRIMEIHDAIADLVMAEQIYQVVQGNFERASGNADAFSKGSYPPETDIMNTPRSGVALTHRIAIQFDTSVDAGVSPTSFAMTPRAKAEPSINKWLSTILPIPEDVQCWVTYSSPVKSNERILVSQAQLKLQELDLLYCFNLDTEQAMTELDDRIAAYVRYEVSNHPKTDIKINYTDPVDATDKTKISFFELAAMVKSLRKIIVGSKFLRADAVLLSPSGEQSETLMDDVQLKARVVALKESLAPIVTGIETTIAATKSISGLAEDLKADLTASMAETSAVDAIASQFKTDLKVYLINPSAEIKNAMLTAFENSILFVAEPAKTILKNKYGVGLDAYVADFSNFDRLAQDTVSLLLNVAGYDNNQTGTGFIHQGISGVYESVFMKIDKLIARWQQKVADFDTLIAGYDDAGVVEEQFVLLQKVEKIVSAQTTFPLPSALSSYKNILDTKKTSFDNLLQNIKALKTNAKGQVTEFVSAAESYIKDVGLYDFIFFDEDNRRNDLQKEKLMIALLKEKISVALTNNKIYNTTKISSVSELIAEADATVVNSNKIKALLEAAKKIVGAEALLLPHFKLNEMQSNEFDNAYRNSDGLLQFLKTKEMKIFPVDDWLGGISRVREKMYYWENASFLSSAFSPTVTMEIIPLQFPYQVDDRWAAMKFRDEKDVTDKFQISGDKLLYTAHFAVPYDKTKTSCGVVIDEWTEVIPGADETTGVAFHYDQPNSEPPQTMLLVTPPEITGHWSWLTIIESMEETLEMAKKRAIEPSHIEASNYAQFLPATMMAVTLYWITVATNLSVNNNLYERIETN